MGRTRSVSRSRSSSVSIRRRSRGRPRTRSGSPYRRPQKNYEPRRGGMRGSPYRGRRYGSPDGPRARSRSRSYPPRYPPLRGGRGDTGPYRGNRDDVNGWAGRGRYAGPRPWNGGEWRRDIPPYRGAMNDAINNEKERQSALMGGVPRLIRGRGGVGVTRLDRDKTCPFLLRVFYKLNGHHDLEEFATPGQEPVSEELQIYTWKDATLRELVNLIKDVCPEARERNARLHFRLIYPDKQGRNVMTEIGTVHSVKQQAEDSRTLQSLKFQIGDFLGLSINILPRNQRQPVRRPADGKEAESDVKAENNIETDKVGDKELEEGEVVKSNGAEPDGITNEKVDRDDDEADMDSQKGDEGDADAPSTNSHNGERGTETKEEQDDVQMEEDE